VGVASAETVRPARLPTWAWLLRCIMNLHHCHELHLSRKIRILLEDPAEWWLFV
jgi:hypothetical protein